MASRYKSALLMVVRTFWSASELNAGQINGVDGIQEIKNFDADWFVREAIRREDIREVRNGRKGTQYTLNRSSRNVIDAALAAGKIADEKAARGKATEIADDAETLELVCLELSEVGDPWFFAEAVAESICVVLGLGKTYWVDVSIDLLLLSLSRLVSGTIERQTRSGGRRVYRVAGAEDSSEIEIVSGPKGSEPTIDLRVVPEEPEPQGEADGVVGEPVERPSPNPGRMSYSDLAADPVVQIMIVRTFFAARKGSWIGATRARSLIVGMSGWEEGTPQGIGRMLGAIARITGYLEYRGEGHDRQYRLTVKAGMEVLGLTEDECIQNDIMSAVQTVVVAAPPPEPTVVAAWAQNDDDVDVEVVVTRYGRRADEREDLPEEPRIEEHPIETVVEAPPDSQRRRIDDLEQFRAATVAIGAERLRRVLDGYPQDCWSEMIALALKGIVKDNNITAE